MSQHFHIIPDDDDNTASVRMTKCGKCGANLFIPNDLAPLETTPCRKCGHPVMKPMRLRQFLLQSIVASGGMGTVYRAYDTTLERRVAVKLMQREFVDDPESVASFSKEARACAGLNHTNIVQIHTFDEHEGEKYIAMELSDQGSLENRIERDGQVDELHVLDVGIKIGGALKAALKHELLHLDIKPDNILYNEEGEPKLVDFGLARKMSEDKADDSEGVMGTPDFIAPERIQRTGEDFRSDMYSLAGTLYNALTGQVPFSTETGDPTEVAMAHVNDALIPPIDIVSITEATNEAIVCAMEKDAAMRYQSYDEFIMALEAARSHLLVKRFNMPEA